MVWNTTQSSLYKAVNDYNSTIGEQEYTHECCNEYNETQDFKSDNFIDKDKQKCSGITENYSQNKFQKQSCQNRSIRSKQDIFADKDFLLILGLILVLTKEGADNKLILALAVVLLG